MIFELREEKQVFAKDKGGKMDYFHSIITAVVLGPTKKKQYARAAFLSSTEILSDRMATSRGRLVTPQIGVTVS